ncbi:hypothetical protein SELMODRAFT_89499 [Selaginella moellendorffii]|uniref:thiamine diphosphokinase n=1 Tax=Selaginella moellendorffii TaxID=88036 RepID=D8RAQ2_SELML|nr:hypothetical protein SELMODRAFT_89499 [Selaginella moellendorffii]
MEGTVLEHRDFFSRGSFALVILNNTLPKEAPILWELARVRVCADGGANRVYREMPSPAERLCLLDQITFFRFVPDHIVGDLDSIEPSIREIYASKGSEILDMSSDQDSTDLHKCVSFLRDSSRGDEVERIVVLGALGGRFDHELGNLNVLFAFPGLRICLASDENLVFLLRHGVLHEIRARVGAHCGLVPLGERSQSSTTTGLRWNLDSTAMAIGSLISTCNVVENEVVKVQSDVDLLWTMER